MDPDDRKSTAGYLYMLSGGAISWKSQKEPIVALSTMDAEYIALCFAVQESAWFRQLLEDLVLPNAKIPIPIKCDNQSAISLATNAQTTKRSKHLDVRWHYSREKADAGEIKISYVSTQQQLADIFTKAVPKTQFQILRTALGLKAINV